MENNVKPMNDSLLKQTSYTEPRHYCKWALLIVTHSLSVLFGFYIGKDIYSIDTDGSL